MSRRTEVQVGITVLVALVTLLWGVTYLKDLTLQRKVTVWKVKFPQTGGLGQSDEVQVNGIRKGLVSKIELAGDGVYVDLGLDSDVKLTSDSKVSIRNVGLMGEKVIFVELHTTGRAYTARDTIPGIFELGMGEVMGQMGGTTESLDRVTRQLARIAARLEESGDVEATVANFRATSEELRAAVEENRKLVHEIVANANSVSATARDLTTERKAQLERTLDSAERSAQNLERLSARLDSLRGDVQVVVAKVDHGDGTLAQLINDRQLYDDVRASVGSLNALIEDIKKNPRKYINLSIF
ncbi:MAG: MCE family protein [Candidatus Eisenbacteria bacterium]|uniref:MCE family protein n=1 Tax=Eiseniibacteriota bacterium TaxID=2212470 RepID=A0A933SBX1_UNCEI|nr:MCE family protein [Candidatus Eisenbacteria bacterium]